MLGGVSVGSFPTGKHMKTKKKKKTGFGLFSMLLYVRITHRRVAFFTARVAFAE